MPSARSTPPSRAAPPTPTSASSARAANGSRSATATSRLSATTRSDGLRPARARRRRLGVRRRARASTTPRSTRRRRARSRSPAPARPRAAGASARSRRRLRRPLRDAGRTRSGHACRSANASRCLLDAERALHSAPTIAVGRAWLDLWRTDKEFYSHDRLAHRADDLSERQRDLARWRSATATRRCARGPATAGCTSAAAGRSIELAELRENAARIGEEAHQLLSAPQCPSGTMDVILGGSQVSLQIHESCGHAAELDRIMGWEANFSGTSFLDPAERGKLQYGSPIVTIEIDNTMPRGFATVGYDDEGTKSVRADVIRDGMLVGFESSRDTARQIGAAVDVVRARRELGARPDDPHVQPEPAARQRAVRAPLRRRARRRLHGSEPLVVDRRSPA